MRNSPEFRDAVVRGSRATRLADACARAWSWRDLSDAQIPPAVAATTHDPVAATLLQEATVLVRWRLQREGDPHLPRRTAITHLVDRCVLEQFPASAPLPGDPHQGVLLAMSAPLLEAVEAVGSPMPSGDAIERLERELATFATPDATMSGTSALHHRWYQGLARWSLGVAYTATKRYDDAHRAFADAAVHYEASGDPAAAAQSRDKVAELGLRLAADFDRATAAGIGRVLSAEDPMARVAATVALMRETGRAGDSFEAGRIAEEAALVLRENGYPDPERNFDGAVTAWLRHVASTRSGDGVVAKACEIVYYWAAILGARTSARLASDPAGSVRAERAMHALIPLTAEITQEADAAHDDEARRLAVWLPAMAPTTDRPLAGEAAVRAMRDAAALDDALHTLRVTLREGASEALLAHADALLENARALGSPLHAARALLEKAHVLLALARPAEVPAVTREAVSTLLGGHEARLSAFATGYERDLYLMALACEARALAAAKDDRALLAMCEPVVRDIEAERARVSSPYAQSAFLATRVEIYEFAIAAAWRLQRWDDVLTLGELLKSRGVLRARLAADSPGAAHRGAALRDVEAAIADAVPGSREERDLRATRRWLVTARAIDRGYAREALPTMTVAALQEALAADEAVVTWIEFGEGNAIVLAISRERIAHARAEPARDDWRAFVDIALALADGDTRRARELGPIVARMGSALLPDGIRSVLAGKSRLALSPHRSLHLFPMHAIAWEGGGFLAESFALRYLPAVTALLLPAVPAIDGPVLCVGVSRFDDGQLPALPAAATEASEIAALHGATPCLDPAVADFLALPLSTCRCLHLATHASSALAGDAVDDPYSARLQLRDGAVDAWQLAQIAMRAELVVLAACHSGQRAIAGRGLDRLPGDELFGLAGALLQAGAGAVLGTLWPVRDHVALDVLVRFHRSYAAGARPDDALQEAIRGYLASPSADRDVFSWAPFFVTLIGRRS